MEDRLRQYVIDNFGNALSRGYIQAYYQPVIRTISGKLCSFEALARWIDPVVGPLRPDLFIPVLEQEKLIHLLDSHIISDVCRRIRRSIDSGETPIPVSVNLSRLDFILCDIFSVVDRCVSDYQIPHDFLYIEITESVMAEQEGLMHTVVDRFHKAGYQVWMDDFGSGYSSLNMLKDYTFDELKLDMCFLRSFDRRSRMIMTSIIQMSKEIDIHTLAEGVEAEEQYIYLRNIGCEKLQGYYFGRPLPFNDAIANLSEKGIEIELPRDRRYYDDIGSVSFLSSSPFLSAKEKHKDMIGRSLNSIPLALVEMFRDDFCLLFCNAAFEHNAGTTIFLPDIFRAEQIGLRHSYSIIPGRIINLLENTKDTKSGRMMFVSNEEYYELKTKLIGTRRESYCVLMQLNNLSQESQSSSTSVLDEGLRQIYTIFERISLLDLSNDAVVPIYTGTKSDYFNDLSGLSEIACKVADRYVFIDDREAFLNFWNPETLEKRLAESGRGSIAEYFRCLVLNGRYEWKQFILLSYRPGQVLELIRSAHTELSQFKHKSSAGEMSEEVISSETLWQNLLKTDMIRIFWKDTERRFLGVNRGFLKFYGFKSEQELIGKNDEDLGWHVHPDLYMNDEYRVINEGITIYNIPGRCISNGVNREIMASKTPVFDANGNILGMMGYFIDRDLLSEHDIRGTDYKLHDELTGLLNAFGLREQARAFQDEFFLRNTDFMCLYVSLDNISIINRQYGFEVGDRAIITLGSKLKEAFGTSASVGRVNGHQFAVIKQLHDRNELSGIRAKIKAVSDSIHDIDGTSITLYLSIGYSTFSETKDIDMMLQSAEMRLMVDHDDHAPVEERQTRSSDFFRLYDDLPISYAVYKVHTNRNRKVTDAELFYANHLFEKRAARPVSEMLGHSVREIFPNLDKKWFDIAGRAALQGETITEIMYYGETDMQYYITANQIIRPGFCSITYQEIDKNGKPIDPIA
ncbi:MAG: EAL domain-containing protein [Lachnospiraceae bacterium]|nr:EAL domain-containing protein [Lachnospiraceae bacterium]